MISLPMALEAARLLRDSEKRLQALFERPVMIHFEFLDYGETSISRVLAAVSFITGIPKELMLSETREGEVPIARFHAYYLLRKHIKMSSPEMGRLFNRDHSTILYGLKKAQDLLAVDKAFQTDNTLIEGRIFTSNENERDAETEQ